MATPREVTSGKVRRIRNPRSTPYDRTPATLRRSPSWVSKMIVDPASKLIFAGAQLFFSSSSSLFSKPLSPPPPPPPVADMGDLVILSQTSPTQTVRRNSRVIEVIDDENVTQTGSSGRPSSEDKNRRRQGRSKRKVADSGCCINLKDSGKAKAKSVAKGLGTSQSVPQPKEPNFSCPVCMGTLLEETSTKCGHIFCKKCISKAITTQSKCPTCRQKLKGKDIFRIYLPTC